MTSNEDDFRADARHAFVLRYGRLMSKGAPLAEATASLQAPAPEPLRVLVPSPLGALALEAVGGVITALKIVPERRERKFYVALKDAPRSDFLDETLGRLSEYFAGARRDLGIRYDLDPTTLDPLAYRVLMETTKIPYGQTRTYQKLASAAGQSDSYRLVRSILIANPIPLLIPCHRVIPRKGGVGTYIAGTRKKEWLLKLEAKGVKTE